MLSKINFSKNKNIPTFFSFIFIYSVDSTKKWILFLFLFSPPDLIFFEKFPVNQTIKKCWPNKDHACSAQGIQLHEDSNKEPVTNIVGLLHIVSNNIHKMESSINNLGYMPADFNHFCYVYLKFHWV